MAAASLYPAYIERDEEREILSVLEQVRETGQSRAVLLYGGGGVGKTRLIRTLAERQTAAGRASWLPPIDVDDSEYWVLANLQDAIARGLDPAGDHFGEYREYLARVPADPGDHVTAEAQISHLRQVRRIFRRCYRGYVKATGRPVVIGLDTIEAIRGMELLISLTRWMKSLPDTLFIMSGRPMPGHGQESHWRDDDGQEKDPIEQELTDPQWPMPVTTVRLAEFSMDAAERYLSESAVADGLEEEEKAKLVRLTRGHPLWLALTVAYLNDKGLPEEASASLAAIERDIPYRGELPASGRRLQDEFKRRILSPYREADFTHESVKRLAVVRRGVNQQIWRELMADRREARGAADPAEAWGQLLATPWIRRRANGHYVTLHDAMAEELSRRVISLHDANRQWRRGLWRRALDIYDAQVQDREREFRAESERLDSRRQLVGGRAAEGYGGPGLGTEKIRLDGTKREVDQLKACGLEFQLLSDSPAGCQRFLDLFAEAKRDQDLLFQDLLATAMERFLPLSDPASDVRDDVVGGAVRDFRAWLASEGQQARYRDIGAVMAEYLVMAGQGERAVALLNSLPLDHADAHHRVRHNQLLGNAYLRVSGHVREGLRYLQEAVAAAEAATELEEAERQRLIAQAHKELGFYYRNVGQWKEADHSYQLARDAISVTLMRRKLDEDRMEMASIQSNWAYVKGLRGLHGEGLTLVDSAIAVRKKLAGELALGMSYSTRGEVLRYQQQFRKAWESYREAEAIFDKLNDSSWLGTIQQEQAICLYQAHLDGVVLISGTDPLGAAGRLALKAVQICRERSVRNYPAALNRAGRIIGHTDAGKGIGYLRDGVKAARELSDGWYWLANLVELAELSYRAWTETEEAEYRAEIEGLEPDMAAAMAEYEFPELRGRWEIVNAHLAIHDWGATGDDATMKRALRGYADGFARIAESGYVGSSASSVIPDAFDAFRDFLGQLTAADREQWLEHLRLAWTAPEQGATMLLAWLEQLY